ncbi:MAG TPA: thiamine pyrophosphate-requiring protein [Hyphomicrobiaceae bacterium]|nr:thiamine pyrophosphate-requiring protein [Hyphomicrobiaceae bacterium]
MPKPAGRFETVAEAYLALLKSRGIDWLFANAGTDFAPIIEALARGRKAGIAMPEAVPIAHETVAVAMAHGYWLLTGRPQAVMVHVNVGTANALMGLINAARDHVPMLFTSGRTPITEQRRHGSRDLPIHWGQEMFDQAGMLREFVKWDYELRYAEQVQAAVDRAMALAMSEPMGPVYLSLPREVLAEPWPNVAVSQRPTVAAARAAHPDPEAVGHAADMLKAAERPLIIAGRSDAAAFAALTAFAEQTAIPVVHFWPGRLAVPTDHPFHAGFDLTPWIEQADAILALDMMVPWLPDRHKLASGARVIHIGPSPGFGEVPMRSFPATLSLSANVAAALAQLGAAMGAASAQRREAVLAAIADHRRRRAKKLARTKGDGLTNTAISRIIDEHKGQDAIVFGELGCDASVMTFTRADGYFGHPIAGGLGWGLPAALGAKLACPDRLVIACVGDGSYMFANPVACHHTAAALDLPILTIVFNNEVWNAVRRSTLTLYPDGHAAAANEMPLSSLAPSPDYEKVVEASGGWGIRVEDAAELERALAKAIGMVQREKRQALINVRCAISR